MMVCCKILKKQMDNCLKAKNSKPRERNVDKTVKEYVKLVKKKSEESS